VTTLATGRLALIPLRAAARTGETLSLVRDEAMRLGALSAVTGCLVRRTWARPAPDACPW